MNFDLGEILSSAFKITWKHKVLWTFSAIPVLVSFLVFPFVFVPIFFMDEGSFSNPFFIEEPLIISLFVVFSIIVSIISYVLYGVSSSSVALGVMRADEGAERLTFIGLFNDSRPYWWRVLGVLLLIGLAVSLVFLVIFGCMALIGVVTAGVGFICLQPLFLLIYPVMMVFYGYIEESQVSVVVDDLGVTDAIKRGWELIRANFWRIVLVSLIVYLGIGLLSSIIVVPFMMPFFFIPFFMDGGQFEFNPRTTMLFMGCFSLVFFPVMALVQGIGITFLKATYTLVYLRLTKPWDDAPVVLEADE
ncbi:MAG TPA: hypothetical protein VIS72_14990 [Anaerolineales bacterium]